MKTRASRLIIHIGGPKTGSSALQSFIALQHDTLEERGVVAPFHPNFSRAKLGKNTAGNGSLLLDPNHLRKDCCAVPEKIYLYSSESLFQGLLDDAALSRVLDLAAEKGYAVTITVMTRNFFEFANSAWNQIVKTSGYRKNFSEFLLADVEESNLAFSPWNFKILLQWLVLAKDRKLDLRVINYETYKKKLIERFFQAVLDVHLSPEELRLGKGLTVNRSLSVDEAMLQIEFNKYFKGNAGRFIAEPLIEQMGDIKQGLQYFSEETYTQVVDKFSPLIREINLHLDSEKVVFTPYDVLERKFGGTARDSISLEIGQVEVLARSISEEIIRHKNPSRRSLFYWAAVSLIPSGLKKLIPSRIKNDLFSRINR